MDRCTFSSSLRSQPGRKSAIAAFRVANWKETRLETHDAELFLPAQFAYQQRDSALRAIIIDSHDLGSEASSSTTWQRIERLYHLNGSGKDAVLVFMLRTGDGATHSIESPDSMNAFMKLQADLTTTDLEIPIISSSGWTDLPQVLRAFHRQLCVNRPPSQSQHNSENITQQALQLLRHTATPGPLSERSSHVLSDLTQGFRNYLEQLADEDSRETLLSYLGEEGQRALAFWLEEHKVD